MLGPYVLEDADFLAWYERWLDEAVAGYDVGFFGERLPLQEPELLTVLTEDPSPERRARAGESLLMLPTTSDTAWDALVGSMTDDPDPTVRAELWELLRRKRRNHPEQLDIAEAIAEYARSCTPPGLKSLNILRKLGHTDVLPELACRDLERRRQAAYQLAWSWSLGRGDVPRDLLHEAADGLLSDADPLLRTHGVGVVRKFCLTHFHPRLREMQETETDPWVQHQLTWCLGRQPVHSWEMPWTAAEQGHNEEPPF